MPFLQCFDCDENFIDCRYRDIIFVRILINSVDTFGRFADLGIITLFVVGVEGGIFGWATLRRVTWLSSTSVTGFLLLFRRTSSLLGFCTSTFFFQDLSCRAFRIRRWHFRFFFKFDLHVS